MTHLIWIQFESETSNWSRNSLEHKSENSKRFDTRKVVKTNILYLSIFYNSRDVFDWIKLTGQDVSTDLSFVFKGIVYILQKFSLAELDEKIDLYKIQSQNTNSLFYSCCFLLDFFPVKTGNCHLYSSDFV